MPRKSPYSIILTREEECELLRRSTKYTLPYFKVVRAKMILLAALDVHRVELFDRLVGQVMIQVSYKEARRVFLVVDNGSAHRGSKSVARLKEKYANLVLIKHNGSSHIRSRHNNENTLPNY
ncbi:MAG: hypothetical protein SVW57_13735 [Thermodesulfobacteriota bacterium]|nr:hypothetical protein [Thermodesulfobacteriota bacterium]